MILKGHGKVCLTQNSRKTWLSTGPTHVDPSLTPFRRQSKWFKGLNMRAEILKVPMEKPLKREEEVAYFLMELQHSRASYQEPTNRIARNKNVTTEGKKDSTKRQLTVCKKIFVSSVSDEQVAHENMNNSRKPNTKKKSINMN